MRSFVRFIFPVSIISLILSFFTGCASDDHDQLSDPNNSDAYVFAILGDTVEIMLDSMPQITVEGEQAVRLNELVPITLVPPYVDRDEAEWDTRALYSYQIIGDDGFSASGSRGHPNNTWDQLLMGYLFISSRLTIFPDDSIDLPGAYNVQETRYIELQRKIDVVRPETVAPDSDAFVEFREITEVTVTNPEGQHEQALPLADFVTRIISDPSGYQFNIRSVDEFGPSLAMTWEQFRTGYWLTVSEKTMFTDSSLVGGRYQLRVLEMIEVLE